MLNFEAMILIPTVFMLFVAIISPAKYYGKVLTVYGVSGILFAIFGIRLYYLGYLIIVLVKDLKMDIFLIKRRRDINWQLHLKNLVYFLILERVLSNIQALFGFTPLVATIAGTYKFVFLCPEFTYSSIFQCVSEHCSDGFFLGSDGFCHESEPIIEV